MNKQLPFPSAKCLYNNIKGILLLFLFLGSASLASAQTVTLADATGEAATLTGGQTNVAVFAFNLTRGTAVNLTGVTVTFSAPIAGIFTNVRLFESTDATFSFGGDTNVGTMTLGSGNDYAATFAGRPIAAAGGTFYFIVVNVDPAILSIATISATCAATQIATTDAETGSATGPTYNSGNITELRAEFSQNGDAATALGDQNGVELLDFTVLSNGTQNITPSLVFTFDVDVTNILENWDLQVGGADIPGTENYALSGGGTILTVTGFTNVDVSTSKNFQLFADIKEVATSANDFTVSLASSGVAVDAGYPEAFTTFTNAIDVTALSADFTQNGDDATALADQNGVELLDFDVLSNGAQSITPSLVFTFDVDVTNILENWDLRVGGSDIPGTENYALSGGGTILTVTGFTNVDVSTTKNFQLLADIKPGATSASDFIITLQTSGVDVNLGYAETFTFTNTVDVTGLTADFTQNGDVGSAVADENGVELLDFTVLSNGAQNIVSPLVFTFNVDVTNILENWDLRVGGSDIAGTENYALSGGGTILTVTGFTNVDIATSKNFQLYADIKSGALTTNDFTITLAPAGVAVSAGSVEAFGTFTNVVDVTVSALSNITYTGGSSSALNYRTRQATTIHDSDLNLSFRLATFRLQDGGGSPDTDIKASSITSITFQITNPDNIRRIALFNETNSQGNDDTEIAGTEQDMPASGFVTFTPSTPIRTLADGGNWNFMVRVTFKATVVDNQVLTVTVNSVTGETEYSAFTSANAGGANSSAGPNKTILVVASKIKFNNTVPNSAEIGLNFAPANFRIVAVDGNTPLSNIDLDYNGKVDFTVSGGAGALTGGGTKTLTAGQSPVIPTLSIDQAGSYTLEVSDDEYNDAPESQVALEDVTSPITITSAASTISPPSALNLCYGGNFQTLGDIVITETDAAGFSGSGTFSIALPTGFVFNTAVNPTLSMTNSTTNFTAIGFTGDNIVQFTYNITAPTGLNQLRISNLKIRYPGSTAPLGGNQITRSGGTAVIAGVGAGTQLGTVSAALGTPPSSFGFTVAKVNPTDTDVDGNETRFSQSSSAVRLVASETTGTNVFTGPGVSTVGAEYRFNPQSLALSPPLYDIVYTHTEATTAGCQFTATKQFEVYSTNITGLVTQYCTKDADTPPLHVASSYINTRFGALYRLKKFVYWNYNPGTGLYSQADMFPLVPNTGGNIADQGPPTSVVFDPDLPAYAQVYARYPSPGIWIGFIVEHTVSLITQVEWTFIRVKTSPTVTISNIVTSFCADDIAITLVGSPANSNSVFDDFFTEVGPGTPVSVSPINPRVWSYTPSALGGAGSSIITYTYRDPATGCIGTSAPKIFTVNARPGTVAPGTITSSGGTTPRTCQGTAIGTFEASNPGGVTYSWYSDLALTDLISTGNTFTPSGIDKNDPTDGTPPPHDFYVTQTIAGCESNRSPVTPTPARQLLVEIVATPDAPEPNFDNDIRSYCVDGLIPAAHLGVPGTDLKWYNKSGSLISVADDNQPTISELQVNTDIDTLFTFSITQTEAVNSCVSLPTEFTIEVKSLPSLTITADIDTTKICTSGSIITFKGSDAGQAVGTGNWTTVGNAFNPPTALIPAGGTAILTPTTLVPGNYVLRFQHQNSAGCANTKDIHLRVLPKVVPFLDPAQACEKVHTPLENKSLYITGGTAAPDGDTTQVDDSNIALTFWDFNDGLSLPFGTGLVPNGTNSGYTRGTFLNPEHVFQVLGSRSVAFTMETVDGCVYTGTKQINVNNKPNINFTWSNPCFDAVSGISSTKFTATEASGIAISSYEWNFSINDSLDFNPGPVGASPVVEYKEIGFDTAQLIVLTNALCRDTIQKVVYVLPIYKAITDTSGYDQNFNLGKNFWISGGIKSSWDLGSTMAGTQNSDGNAWATGLAGPNKDGERSWVMSGCFNFKYAAKPVVSLDTWSDTPFGVDGAVFQYNVDGEIENESSWKVLGDASSGINWYDGSGISNSPGNQSANDYGWTGVYPSGWRNAIYKLDEVKPGDAGSPTEFDSLVVFRVAFAGGNRLQSGFAFDNVFIGERSRVVLLENFTNSSSSASSHSLANYENFASSGNSNEIIKIQYHTAFPGNDPVNELNDQMNNARAAFYGITIAPTVRIDGDFSTGSIGSWLPNTYDDRVLTPSSLKLNVTAVKDGDVVKINTSVENTTSQEIEAELEKLHIFTVVIDTLVDETSLLGNSGKPEFINVARQMLPSPAGVPITGEILPGAANAFVAQELTWRNPTGTKVVVFVQKIDGNHKDVYQAVIVKPVGGPPATVVTGTEDPEYAKHIHVYPNPANNEVNIQLPGASAKPTPVVLFDTFGRPVYQGEFKAGETVKTISTSGFADGMYMMQLLAPQGDKVIRKVMVRH